ncbi:MAG: Integral membrane protein TerC [Ktedonobacterales bacterium]|jgi:tellurite resistance protein TerC|nr:MAG: Integral membrane protein TerC [Ktedonobacterales bacterium]
MASGTLVAWVAFNIFVLGLLALDLGVINRKAHVVSFKEAAIWSAVWIGLALLFNGFIFFWRGPDVGLQFFTGYIIEKTLSIDNIFVFVLIFSAFAVPAAYQQRVLLWGVLGALVMRGLLIAFGAVLISTFDWVFYVFGAFLVITGARMAFHKEGEIHPNRNIVVRLARRIFPVTDGYEGARFFTRRHGLLYITPLLIVLLVVETTDIIFALDSIPAIFAVTTDPFIVYTSNVFAILGLRSLYFLLAGSVSRFAYLRYGLSAVLVLVGIKMLVAELYHPPLALWLGLIVAILGASIVLSLARPPKPDAKAEDLESASINSPTPAS